ncbi:hypothetical protein AKG34_11895 [Peribacillus butanolivorans]|nr:hypothetical protein AKG34_11895 [Peribacillus butanolivorans]
MFAKVLKHFTNVLGPSYTFTNALNEIRELDQYKGKDENVYFYKLIAAWNQDLLKFNQESH